MPVFLFVAWGRELKLATRIGGWRGIEDLLWELATKPIQTTKRAAKSAWYITKVEHSIISERLRLIGGCFLGSCWGAWGGGYFRMGCLDIEHRLDILLSPQSWAKESLRVLAVGISLTLKWAVFSDLKCNHRGTNQQPGAHRVSLHLPGLGPGSFLSEGGMDT